MDLPLQPVRLRGRLVELVPLTWDHVAALTRIGLDAELWRLQPKSIDSDEAMREYVESALADQRRGVSLPFAILDCATATVIGSTRYMDISASHRRLEIGATWLAPAFQRSGANTEAKLLLLTHAFETLRVIRVVFKTEAQNGKSRTALLRIGAREEGTFRSHLIADCGRRRDMVFFAVLDDEWPAVKSHMEDRLRLANQV